MSFPAIKRVPTYFHHTLTFSLGTPRTCAHLTRLMNVSTNCVVSYKVNFSSPSQTRHPQCSWSMGCYRVRVYRSLSDVFPLYFYQRVAANCPSPPFERRWSLCVSGVFPPESLSLARIYISRACLRWAIPTCTPTSAAALAYPMFSLILPTDGSLSYCLSVCDDLVFKRGQAFPSHHCVLVVK